MEVRPDEIYNLAAQTHVQHSFYMPSHTFDVNFKGLLNLCESVLRLGLAKSTRIFHASTSEMFGQRETASGAAAASEAMMDENFPFNPASPYAVSKISAFYLVRYYRKVHQLRISTGMTFNHESPLRHELFITRKITKAVA
jgi:GDPmannose 4,6-dehydratase